MSKQPYEEERGSTMPGAKASCNPIRVEEGGLKPFSKRNKSEATQSASLFIASNKRRTAGFHIYPEYENAIDIIALYGRHRNKGKAVEFLVDFYLSSLPEEKQKYLRCLIEGKIQVDHGLQ